MVKRTKELNLSNITYYKYDNGVQVYYTKVKNPKKHLLKICFNGGSSAQGKYMGLAHFTEHIMCSYDDLKEIILDGSTGVSNTTYVFGISDNKLRKIVTSASEVKEVEQKFQQKDLTKEQKDELNREYNKLCHQIQKSLLKKYISINLKTFFDCVKRDYVDENEFEKQKQIIDNEFITNRRSGQYQNINVYPDYIMGCNDYKICGNLKTLNNVTLEDYVNYKKASYTKENMIVYIESNEQYEDFEQLIIDIIDKNSLSNPNTIFPREHDKIDITDAYFINRLDDGGIEKDVVNLLFNLVAKRDALKNDIDITIGNMVFRKLFKANINELYSQLRGDKKYIYSMEFDSKQFRKLYHYYVSLTLRQKNVSDAIVSVATFINSLVQGYNQEDFYKFKHFINAEAIDAFFADYNVEFWQDFPLEVRENIYRVIKTCDVSYLQKCLKKYAEILVTDIVVSNNTDITSLPDIDYLVELVHGKEPAQTINLVKQKGKNKKVPIELNLMQRDLPMVVENTDKKTKQKNLEKC